MHPDQQTDSSAKAEQDVLIGLAEPFVDSRGIIQPLVDGDFKSAQLISSVAGSVRANHYHKKDYHYMYLLSGAFDYYYRPTGSDNEPKCLRVNAGEVVYTPPMIDHAVRFVEDTTFVNFAGRERDQGSYEDDLVRIELIPAE
jgi:dTDP-4-dehydrorhamnose 3,5-epimerase-like enzyme